MILKTFFGYYGSKYGYAPFYPEPIYKDIIEPFAGGAGYSLRYFSYNIVLYDLNPVIAGLWDYLIKASVDDILNLPDRVENVEEMTKYCQEAKWLVGFWLGIGDAAPRNKLSTWGKSDENGTVFWSPRLRKRIAAQLKYIRHWKVFNKSCFDVPNKKATWFVDPPYNNDAGKVYKQKFTEFDKLGKWCKSRKGQVIVCEQDGADWLPFSPFMEFKTCGENNKVSKEVIWTNIEEKDPFDKFLVKK